MAQRGLEDGAGERTGRGPCRRQRGTRKSCSERLRVKSKSKQANKGPAEVGPTGQKGAPQGDSGVQYRAEAVSNPFPPQRNSPCRSGSRKTAPALLTGSSAALPAVRARLFSRPLPRPLRGAGWGLGIPRPDGGKGGGGGGGGVVCATRWGEGGGAVRGWRAAPRGCAGLQPAASAPSSRHVSACVRVRHIQRYSLGSLISCRC